MQTVGRVIGLIGGTSWPSTMLYYEKINQLTNKKLGGFHSAKILLYSIDYHEIKSNYQNDWNKVEVLLKNEIEFFLNKSPDCLIICNNTLHKVFDTINLNLGIPLFHAGKLSVQKAQSCGYKSVLLLGTKFTMEDGFFAKYFEDIGIYVITPTLEDRIAIQNMQTQISAGIKNDDFFTQFGTIIEKYPCDSVCLACTELPLYVNHTNCNMPIINPTELQCVEAVRFASAT